MRVYVCVRPSERVLPCLSLQEDGLNEEMPLEVCEVGRTVVEGQCNGRTLVHCLQTPKALLQNAKLRAEVWVNSLGMYVCVGRCACTKKKEKKKGEKKRGKEWKEIEGRNGEIIVSLLFSFFFVFLLFF